MYLNLFQLSGPETEPEMKDAPFVNKQHVCLHSVSVTKIHSVCPSDLPNMLNNSQIDYICVYLLGISFFPAFVGTLQHFLVLPICSSVK